MKVGPKKTGREALQTFEWASSGNHFAFVYNDQVFFSASPDTVDAVRVSEEDGRRHGVFDWVYEEEVSPSLVPLASHSPRNPIRDFPFKRVQRGDNWRLASTKT